MPTIMSYLTAFGLAGGAGGKAFVPLLALGAFHYTEYFELTDKFLWIANPAVLVVMGALLIAEILVDSVPELGEYADIVAYFPKFVAGFIAFAAATGSVDDSLVQLGTSGVLGGGTAASLHWFRNRIRSPFRLYVEDIHGGTAKIASISEAGASAAVATSAFLVPPLAIILIGLIAIAAFFTARRLDARRLPCKRCGKEIRPGALKCPHCKELQ